MPTSVGQRPRRRLSSRRLRTATRASSPTRPGSTALASSPTQKAANTSGKLGNGGGIAEWITASQANERATIESRLSPTAAATHSH